MKKTKYIAVLSPGKELHEIKNEDRLRYPKKNDPDQQMAILCDGVSSSPEGGKGAQFITDHLHEILIMNELPKVVEGLNEKRASLLSSKIIIDKKYEHISEILSQVTLEKRAISYQSTMIAAHFLEADNKRIIRWINCGDAALFVFCKNTGRLIFNSLNLEGEKETIKHTSPLTDVLPDDFDPLRVKFQDIILPDEIDKNDVCILLCSDGLYDSFDDFYSIYEWLKKDFRAFNNRKSQRPRIKKLLQERHKVLEEKMNDDDISFVLFQLHREYKSILYDYSKDAQTEMAE